MTASVMVADVDVIQGSVDEVKKKERHAAVEACGPLCPFGDKIGLDDHEDRR